MPEEFVHRGLRCLVGLRDSGFDNVPGEHFRPPGAYCESLLWAVRTVALTDFLTMYGVRNHEESFLGMNENHGAKLLSGFGTIRMNLTVDLVTDTHGQNIIRHILPPFTLAAHIGHVNCT